MAKHIMLLFLSDVKTYMNGQTACVSSARYTIHGEKILTTTTNESAVRYLLQSEWEGQAISHLDRIFIFASAMVRNKYMSVKMGDEKIPVLVEGSPMTHLQYFLHVIRTYIPLDDAEAKQAIYPYEEDASMEEALGMVADMAERIRAFVRDLPAAEEVVLHADCTGGLRHANMMMMALMRLMEYQRVRIGKVLYSKFDRDTNTGEVEEANEIYQMFNLISGAEEFVQFGSVSAIDRYFSCRKKSPELQVLLMAMDNFAEEIKLCHRGRFQEAIRRLREALERFEQSQALIKDRPGGTALGDKLMRQLQNRIRKDYGVLLQDHVGELIPIRWCLEHDYLQQALTLYTECVPEYLCSTDMQLISMNAEQRQEMERYREAGDRRSANFFLINLYEQKKYPVEMRAESGKTIEQLRGRFKEKLIRLLKNGAYDKDVIEKSLYAVMEELPELYVVDWQHLMQRLAQLRELHDAPSYLLETKTAPPWAEEILAYYTAWCKKKGKTVFDGVDTGAERFRELLSFIKGGMDKVLFWKFFGSVQQNFADGLSRLVDEEKVSSRLPKGVLISILNRYNRVKAERNCTNHAKIERSRFGSAKELKAWMEQGLNELENAAHEYGQRCR